MPAKKSKTKSELIEELEKKNKELEELKDENLRLLAEIQNLHKRYEREIKEARKSERKEVVRQIAEVIDIMLSAVDEISKTADEAVASGFKLISDELNKKLSQLKIKIEKPVGKKFDIKYHYAVGVTETDEHDDDTIIEVVRSGIYLEDEVLRPAMVVVAKNKNK